MTSFNHYLLRNYALAPIHLSQSSGAHLWKNTGGGVPLWKKLEVAERRSALLWPLRKPNCNPNFNLNLGLPTFRTTGWNKIASFVGLGLVGLGLGLGSQASRVYLRSAKGG